MVFPVVIPYDTEVEHDGRLYAVSIPALQVLRCANCQTIILDDVANKQISEAFRSKGGLLAPEQIRKKREELRLTQKQLAAYLDVSESTLSRWETGAQIQQRAMDRLLRGFFEVREFRSYLGYQDRVGRRQPTLESLSGTTSLTPATTNGTLPRQEIKAAE